MATVETRALTKRFDRGGNAVDRIDLSVRESEFMVLLGPSGSGKTTLLRLIAGLEQPTSGKILLDGIDVTGLPPRARNMAMVFQSYALYPHLSVFGNIAFPLHAQGMRRPDIEERVDWAARMFGISALLKRKPRQLSGGERQRVALARAVVREPVVFLLDEPLSNLDAKLRSSAREELQQFHHRLATTTIYVTHDQVEALALGDRIVILDHGAIHQIGTPQEIYERPADTFVATFIGAPPMNLVKPEGQRIMGFRPEHFLPLESFRDAAAVLNFSFRIHRVENLGSHRLLYGELQGAGQADKVIARVPGTVETVLTSGESMDFAVKKQNLHYFDPTTGFRLDA